VRSVFEVIFHLSVGPFPVNRLQPFLTHRVTLPMLSILRNFILIGEGVSAGQVPENRMFP
jgi:hypothetical protein